MSNLIIAILSSLLASLTTGDPVTSGTEAASKECFTLSEERRKEWRISAAAQCAPVVDIEPTWAEPTHRILALRGKESVAYNTATDQLLLLFYHKNMAARITLVNYDGDPQRAEAAITPARAGVYDLIFAVGSEATKYLTTTFSGEELTPVVSVCAKDPVRLGHIESYDEGSKTNVAYTSLNVPVNVQLDYIRKLRPQLKYIFVLYAEANVSARLTQVDPLVECAGVRESDPQTLECPHVSGSEFEVIRVAVQDRAQAVAELKHKIPAAINGVLRKDADAHHKSILWITGSTSVFNEMATITNQARGIPILSAVPDLVRNGADSALMSIGVGFRANAHKAGLYALDILSAGEKPKARTQRAGSLPVGTVLPPDIAINFQIARSLNLSIPFPVFESASNVFDRDGHHRRKDGQVNTKY